MSDEFDSDWRVHFSNRIHATSLGPNGWTDRRPGLYRLRVPFDLSSWHQLQVTFAAKYSHLLTDDDCSPH